MKKLLVITYYWPPGGGAGVQRWLKFAKYLREFGWEPVIYTPENGEMPVIDESLIKDVPEGIEVIRTPIKEPYGLYKKLVGQKKNERINTGFLTERKKPRLTEKLAVWIRGNWFIPDARKGWIQPSVTYLKKYLAKHPVDAIASTGPPHSMHMIALALKKELGLPWVADFRDPWTNIDFYKDLMLTKRSDAKHRSMEQEVLQTADCTLVVGPTLGKELHELGAKRVEVITNGYDAADMKPVQGLDEKFTIVHIGTMVRTRNPVSLWKALRQLIDGQSELVEDLGRALEIKLVGKADVSVMASLEENGLMPYVNKKDYVNHDKVVEFQQRAQVLLLVLNNTPNAKGILTGKLFEYLAARRPILCIGEPDSDGGRIITETGSGTVVTHHDLESTKQAVLNFYQQYESGQLANNAMGIEQYERKELTKRVASILDKLLKP